MLRRRVWSPVFTLSGVLITLDAAAPDKSAAVLTPSVEVTAIVPNTLENVPGSTFLIDEETLDQAQPFTAREALRLSPGVHIVDEEAFATRLNIGIRGLDPRRSARNHLLEDGMPFQLAPYSDPSNAYHPPIERVRRIEILKGSGQIVYGPQTVGGVVNFVGYRPPSEPLGGELALSGGNRDFFSGVARIGAGQEWGGILFEALHKQGDGTRDHHDHEIDDFVLTGVLDFGSGHRLTLRGGYYEEDSHISEAGTDTARFDADPYNNPFRDDVFEAERVAGQAIHELPIGSNAVLTTRLYYQDIARASYRQIDDSADEMTEVEATGCVDDALTDYENFAPLCGNKMRPRDFTFIGLEPRLEIGHKTFGIQNNTLIGVRAHYEEVTRRRFNGQTPDAREGDPGSELRDRTETDADAYSVFVQNTFFLGRLHGYAGSALRERKLHEQSDVFRFRSR